MNIIIDEGIRKFRIANRYQKDLTPTNFLKNDRNYYSILCTNWQRIQTQIETVFDNLEFTFRWPLGELNISTFFTVLPSFNRTGFDRVQQRKLPTSGTMDLAKSTCQHCRGMESVLSAFVYSTNATRLDTPHSRWGGPVCRMHHSHKALPVCHANGKPVPRAVGVWPALETAYMPKQ